MNLNVHVHDDNATRVLERIDHKLDVLLMGLLQAKETIAMDLSTLTAAVEADTSATNSAITLLGSLADELRAAATDPAAVNALADTISANASALADAVVANTPTT